MRRRTLREYLCISNPELTVLHNATTVSAKSQEIWPAVQDWTPWEGFTHDINTLFSNILAWEFELADPPPLPYAQQHIRDERSFEFVLARWNNIIVNEALRAACDRMEFDSVTWTVGSIILSNDGRTIRPDWAGVTNNMFSEMDSRTSLIPGDTKLAGRDPFGSTAEYSLLQAAEWDINQSSQIDSDGLPFTSPLHPAKELTRGWMEQVNYYAYCLASRYCYVISNQELLVIRRTEETPITPSTSIARNRERRVGNVRNVRETTPTPTSLAPASIASQVPLSPPDRRQTSRACLVPAITPPLPVHSVLSEPLLSSPGYTDDGNPEMNMADLEILSIPWDRSDGLTVNLALFALHLLAYVSRDVRHSYPGLREDPSYRVFSHRHAKSVSP